MKDRIHQHYYSLGRYVWDGHHHHYQDGNGLLFADGRYPTKLTREDMPEWFVDGYGYHVHGFFSAKGVKDLLYWPSHFTNHLFKDDFLFISYEGKIQLADDCGLRDVHGYDHVVHGWLVVNFIKAVDKYSDFDTTPIKRQINEKLTWYQAHWDVHREVPAEQTTIFDDV